MRWESVCLESIGYVLPEERVASSQLEERIAPIYKAMNLGMGQLVAMTGIEERRFWPPNRETWTKLTRAPGVGLQMILGVVARAIRL